jgi:polysaccharide deacetylase family protein (PEP-CTERM system associated)
LKFAVVQAMPDIFTIDVEDWFHILETNGTPDLSSWNSLPTRLEQNLGVILELLAASKVRATLFTLGWVAKRFPRLLREAADLGHEIASHGYAHQIVHRLSRTQFREDIRTAKATIEDATGNPVRGYRAPGFSITREILWAFDEIVDAGYSFDSSIFPGKHGHGGILKASRTPSAIRCSAGYLIEFPLTVADTLLGPQCFFGGGYLRLAPLSLVQMMAAKVRSEGRSVIWYVHPREIDPDHPRLAMPLKRRFKSYVNIHGTAAKLKTILESSSFVTMGELAAGFSVPAADLHTGSLSG